MICDCELNKCEKEVLSLGPSLAPVFGLSERRIDAIKASFLRAVQTLRWKHQKQCKGARVQTADDYLASVPRFSCTHIALPE